MTAILSQLQGDKLSKQLTPGQQIHNTHGGSMILCEHNGLTYTNIGNQAT